MVHIWCWFLSKCLQILQEVFLKYVLSKYQLIVSEDATCVDETYTLRKDPSRDILTRWRVIGVIAMFVHDSNWKVLKSSIWIQKKYTRRELPVFFVVSTQDAVSVTWKISHKECNICLLSLFVSFSTAI